MYMYVCVCVCVYVCVCGCVHVCMYIGASALVQGLSLRDALDTLLEARSAAVIRRFFIFSFSFFLCVLDRQLRDLFPLSFFPFPLCFF